MVLRTFVLRTVRCRETTEMSIAFEFICTGSGVRGFYLLEGEAREDTVGEARGKVAGETPGEALTAGDPFSIASAC